MMGLLREHGFHALAASARPSFPGRCPYPQGKDAVAMRRSRRVAQSGRARVPPRAHGGTPPANRKGRASRGSPRCAGRARARCVAAARYRTRLRRRGQFGAPWRPGRAPAPSPIPRSSRWRAPQTALLTTCRCRRASRPATLRRLSPWACVVSAFAEWPSVSVMSWRRGAPSPQPGAGARVRCCRPRQGVAKRLSGSPWCARRHQGRSARKEREALDARME